MGHFWKKSDHTEA